MQNIKDVKSFGAARFKVKPVISTAQPIKRLAGTVEMAKRFTGMFQISRFQ